jgi:acetyltransferase-like isoleucine patch superfamily enzyme
MEKTHAAITSKGSPLKKYQEVMVGRSSLAALLYYELCILLTPVPGALGLVLRKLLWPRMFGSCGKGCTFAANIVIRHPGRIHLGKSVIISEGCILDGRHGSASNSIVLGDNVILSNGVMLSCKNGTIVIGDNTGLNAQTIVQSTNDCPVIIGKDCVIGQRCFIIGGGNYNIDRVDIPIREQGIKKDRGAILEDDIWLGGNVSVLGGVIMGKGSVAATGSVITRSVSAYSVNMGVPARTVRARTSV